MAKAMENRQPILEVENLQVFFTSGRRRRRTVVRAVDDVSFVIHEGETFGLVGESGCGKTTTGRAIIRLYNPTAGTVRFRGREISGRMTKELRKYLTNNIAMIFQDPVESLNPRMTIQEIVEEGLKVRGMRDPAKRKELVASMLNKIGLTQEHASRYPHEFSGGQRQRVGVARALITNPSLVIADEPVSALDVSIQAQIINLLNDLKADLGLTILFIAHDLSVVKYFSDRVAVMYYGKLVEMAESDELYRHPLHPYTKSLLSAVPQPNPLRERKRKRISYDPATAHDYSVEQPSLREVYPGHFVYCSASEFMEYQRERGSSEG
ncbi:MAG: ABC transporter ATP-binding protein [Bacillota bacterium]|jgi:ABC-type oligopeptide transport system ATPase subunit